MRLSVIIPALNEANGIGATLASLQALRGRGHEVILVDGGSSDTTLEQAQPLVDHVLSSPAGRARQMNAGAAVANGDIFWFLHADSGVPEEVETLILQAMDNTRSWGRFDVRLSGRQPLLRVVERLMNLRSRITGIATGDQGLFVSRSLFEAIGGYADIPLMEDIDLSKRLKRLQPPVCLRESLLVSSRRWEQRGIVRTIALMWTLRLAWYLGVPAERLAVRYE